MVEWKKLKSKNEREKRLEVLLKRSVVGPEVFFGGKGVKLTFPGHVPPRAPLGEAATQTHPPFDPRVTFWQLRGVGAGCDGAF
jgi:hypothetical protein